MENAAEIPAAPAVAAEVAAPVDGAATDAAASAGPAAPAGSAEPAPIVKLAPPANSGFAQMRLKVGDPIHVEFQSRLIKDRATVTVLGWLDGQCLMLTAPQDDTLRLGLKEGERVLLRLFTGQNAFAFSALVQKVVNVPFRYLHVSFPDKVERATVRSSPRCLVNLPARITAGGKPAVEVTIVNIGTTGALIDTAETFAKDGGQVEIILALELHGVPVSLKLPAEISGEKSRTEGDGKHQYGMRFGELDDNARLVLGSLLYYQMLEHPRSVI